MLVFKWKGKPPDYRRKYKFIQAEIRKALVPVGRDHLKMRRNITANFRNKPTFGFKRKVGRSEISLRVWIKDDHAGLIWKFLNFGTKPHIIKAKNAPFLVFRGGQYIPKTFPPANYGGPGRATGDIVRKRIVKHPGTKPRKFDQTINEKLQPKLMDAVRTGLRKGLRKG